jgi:hypothetical protein
MFRISRYRAFEFASHAVCNKLGTAFPGVNLGIVQPLTENTVMGSGVGERKCR